MIFFAQKVLRKLPGNWTFVVVTDRQELDKQIYKNFASVGAVTEPEESVRAESGDHLRQLLGEDHRYVFTLIQKFRTEPASLSDALRSRRHHRHDRRGPPQPVRHPRREHAHRPPNAAFIGFTGTPSWRGRRRRGRSSATTSAIYNFQQSVEDQATVPLYYENRIPELQLLNERPSTRRWSSSSRTPNWTRSRRRGWSASSRREYHLITRDDRLETIAEDLVQHFIGRGYQGKAMVVSIDKAPPSACTTRCRRTGSSVRSILKREILATDGQRARRAARGRIAFMEPTDMAVVVSQSQNEIDDCKKKGLDILPHRKRMVEEDLETKFKDPDDPLRIVFVCACG